MFIMWKGGYFMNIENTMIRVNDAIISARMNGKKITKKDIAALLWKDSKQRTQAVNMSALCNHRIQTIKIEWVKEICEATGVDANFLFNINPKK